MRVRDESSPASPSGGSRTRLFLRLAGEGLPRDAFAVAKALVAVGVPLLAAKRAVDSLYLRRSGVVEAQHLHDLEVLRAALAAQGVSVARLEVRKVDLKALRERLGVSQEAFALRYGLDVATLRNWEQGRTQPDGPAAVLLQLIERDPDKVVELLAS